jgi:hypothetical protein
MPASPLLRTLCVNTFSPLGVWLMYPSSWVVMYMLLTDDLSIYNSSGPHWQNYGVFFAPNTIDPSTHTRMYATTVRLS